MSNGGELEITSPSTEQGHHDLGRGSGKSLQAPFSNWVVLWASMP